MPAPTGAVIWLQDLGEADPRGFSSAVSVHTPHLAIVCPSAPYREAAHGGKPAPAWFDVGALPVRANEPTATTDGFAESLKMVNERMESIRHAMPGLDSTHLVLGGFGQGGALALAAALTCRQRLAGVLVHSGWFAVPPEIDLSACAAASPNKRTPFFVIHGEDDETVEPACAVAAVDELRRLGFEEVHRRSLADLAHKMSHQSLGQCVDFLLARLPVGGASSAAHPSGAPDGSAQLPAKSRSVVKVNGRRGAAEPAPSAKPAPPAAHASVVPAPPPSAPPPSAPAVAKAAVNASSKASSVADPPPAGAARAPPSGAATAPPPPSADTATAAALRARDKDALQRALAARGDSAPLGEAEMIAIAQLMLGEEAGAQLAPALAALPEAAIGGGRAAPAGSAPVASGTRSAPPANDLLDSDDEEPDPDTTTPAPPPPAVATRAEPPPPPPPALAAGAEPPPTAPTLAAAPAMAHYELIEEGDGLVLVMRLPESVASLSEVDLQLSSTHVALAIGDREVLQDVELPRPIHVDGAKAKFARRTGTLRVTLPWQPQQ